MVGLRDFKNLSPLQNSRDPSFRAIHVLISYRNPVLPICKNLLNVSLVCCFSDTHVTEFKRIFKAVKFVSMRIFCLTGLCK